MCLHHLLRPQKCSPVLLIRPFRSRNPLHYCYCCFDCNSCCRGRSFLASRNLLRRMFLWKLDCFLGIGWSILGALPFVCPSQIDHFPNSIIVRQIMHQAFAKHLSSCLFHLSAFSRSYQVAPAYSSASRCHSAAAQFMPSSGRLSRTSISNSDPIPYSSWKYRDWHFSTLHLFKPMNPTSSCNPDENGHVLAHCHSDHKSAASISSTCQFHLPTHCSAI